MDSQVARRLSLVKHPRCSKLSGGQAIELLAKDGDRTRFRFRTPMGQRYDCCFSFAGLRNQVTMTIMKKEAEEGMRTCVLHIHKPFVQTSLRRLESGCNHFLQCGNWKSLCLLCFTGSTASLQVGRHFSLALFS